MSFDAEVVRGLFRDAGVKEQVIAKLAVTASLVDAGVDSLDFANVLLTIEERYGVKIPDEQALEINSLRALAEYVRARLD